MKKIFITVILIAINTFLFSCSTSSESENDSLYEVLATEGDDGDVVTPPPPPEDS